MFTLVQLKEIKWNDYTIAEINNQDVEGTVNALFFQSAKHNFFFFLTSHK